MTIMPESMTELKYVDPDRHLGLLARVYVALSATRLGLFLSRRISWKLDPFLLRVTGGRFSTAVFVRTAVLETRGARSGEVRRNAVIYFHDGDRVTIIPSNAGSAQHPAWFHNLRAHPDVRLAALPMKATIVSDEADRQRLWTLADRVFPPFAKFRRDAAEAKRTIPIVQLIAPV